MKLVTFTIGSGEPRVGAINLDETRVVDLAAVDNQPYLSDKLGSTFPILQIARY